MAGIKHKKTLAGPNGTDNTRVQPTDWNDDHLIESIDLIRDDTPDVPPADTVRVFGRLRGGRMMPAFMGPSGLDTTIQPFLGGNSWAMWAAVGNSTSIGISGSASTLTAVGTATAANMAVTSLHTKIKRLDYLVTTAATTAVAGWRTAANLYCREIGYTLVIKGAPATGQSNASGRFFMGLQANTTNPTDVAPSTLLNMIGFGWEAGDTTVQLYHNDGSGVATKVSLGVNFPKYTTDRATMYEVMLFAPPGGTSVKYQFTDMTTGQTTFGEITSADQPPASTFVSPRMYASVGGVSSVVGITFSAMYVESDY